MSQQNEPEEYSRAELSWILGEPVVRGLEMMGGKDRKLISMEFGDEFIGQTKIEKEVDDAEQS
jgi:hypothetical protein